MKNATQQKNHENSLTCLWQVGENVENYSTWGAIIGDGASLWCVTKTIYGEYLFIFYFCQFLGIKRSNLDQICPIVPTLCPILLKFELWSPKNEKNPKTFKIPAYSFLVIHINEPVYLIIAPHVL